MKQLFIFAFLFYTTICYGQNNDSVLISVMQPEVYIVKNEWSQQINLDVSIGNRMSETINLKRINLSIYDSNENLINLQTLRDGPVTPSLGTVPVRQIKPNENVTVYNPFTIFNPYIDLHRLKFEISFKKDSGKNFTISIEVKPKLYISKTDMSIPLRGRLFIADGNDFYANHRRFDVNNPLVRDVLDMHTNPEMFAMDFTIIDAQGEECAEDWNKNENHYIWGQTVYAPGSGKIIKTNNHFEDNKPGSMNFNIQDAKANNDLLPGNCVVIDHLNGEYSFLVHLKKGSVRVKEGEMVQKGQPIGQVGNSGSSMYPHLHYQLGDKPDYLNSNGLPIYYRDYNLIAGDKKIEIKKGYVSTGDIVEQN